MIESEDSKACCFSCRKNHTAWGNKLPGEVSSDIVRSELSSVSLGGDSGTRISMADSERQTDYGDELEVESVVKSRKKKSLRASICLKLSIFVGLLVMVAAGVPALVLWIKAHEQLVEEIERRLMTVSTLRQEQLKDYLLSQMDKAELIASRVIITNYLANRDVSNKALAEFDLKSAVEVISDFNSAAIYDRDGQIDIATDKTLFEQRISLQPNQSEMLSFPLRTVSGWMYNLSKPIYENETLIGILMTWVNATKLVNLVYDRTGLQGTGELLVGVQENSTTVRLLLSPLQMPLVNTISNDGAIRLAINEESGILTERDYGGSEVIVAYRPVGFMHWGLLAKLKTFEAYAPVQSVRTVIITTIVLLVFFGVLTSVGLAKVFTSPITELGRVAVALGQNNMRARVKEGTILLRDEIADLKDMFNSMANQIATHQLVLEHKVRERTSELARANEGLAKEIEERRRIEEELEKAKDIAIAANRSKSEFLANMSHEIRTPLNAVINFTELCLDTSITPEQQEHLDYVRFAAQHLLRLITDILDFSKIEAGKLEMEEIQFSLFNQLEHAVSVMAARACKNGLELCCSFEADVPDQLLGDPGRLLQIFVNLIGNGIKFTKEGEVVVCVSVKVNCMDVVELLFSVKDTGLGIPESKQSLLFQAFSQLDSSTQRLYGGTGLGLVISSKLVAAMGGRIWVESDGIEGHGSTFWFTARFGVPQGSNVPCTSRKYLFKDAVALVVDDNETSLQVLVNLLKKWGITADGVTNVEAAKHALSKAADSGQKYCVVLLDMWLRGTNSRELVDFLGERPSLLEGYSATSIFHAKSSERCLLEEASSKSRIGLVKAYKSDALSSIIMLTSVNHTDTTRCKELGIRIHTSKPVKQSLLLRLLHEALGIVEKPSNEEGTVLRGSQTQSRSLHILVAEDNVVNQRLAVMLLQKWGHTVVLAMNGAEAVERSSREVFNLILMDVQMPICDGFEATIKIRELEKAQNKTKTPIVAMTAHAMSGDGDRCFAAGMDFYISKPLNAKKLQELLQNVAAGDLKGHDAGCSSPIAEWLP